MPQNEAKTGGDFFQVLYSDPERLRGFAKAMTGISVGSAQALAATFPWDWYQTVIDIGCAEGCVPVQLAREHEHLSGGGFDLPRQLRFLTARRSCMELRPRGSSQERSAPRAPKEK